MKADRVSPDGLNQSQLKSRPVARSPDLASATSAKISSRASWKPHEHELDLLRGGDAAVRDPGGDGEKGQAGQDVDQLVLPQRPEVGLLATSPRNW